MTTDNDEREQRLADLRAMEINAGRFWLEHSNETNLSRIYEVPDSKKPWERIIRSEWVTHEEARAIQDRLLRGR